MAFDTTHDESELRGYRPKSASFCNVTVHNSSLGNQGSECPVHRFRIWKSGLDVWAQHEAWVLKPGLDFAGIGLSINPTFGATSPFLHPLSVGGPILRRCTVSATILP